MKIRGVLAAIVLTASGCSFLQPVKDVSVHHLLDPLVADRPLKSARPALAIKRPSLPAYLDRQQLVTRSAGNLAISRDDLWAEPLDAAISRVTASNLSRLTGSLNVQPVETFTALDYTQLLELRIDQFEPDPLDRMILQGTWKLQPISAKETSGHFFHIAVPIDLPVSAATRVRAMSQALEKLARQIAANQEDSSNR